MRRGKRQDAVGTVPSVAARPARPRHRHTTPRPRAHRAGPARRSDRTSPTKRFGSIPRFAVAYNNLGRALRDSGRREEGSCTVRTRHPRAARLRRPPQQSRRHPGAAGTARRGGGTISHRTAAVAPQSADAHNNLGLVLAQTGDNPAAIEHLAELGAPRPITPTRTSTSATRCTAPAACPRPRKSTAPRWRVDATLADAHYQLAIALTPIRSSAGRDVPTLSVAPIELAARRCVQSHERSRRRAGGERATRRRDCANSTRRSDSIPTLPLTRTSTWNSPASCATNRRAQMCSRHRLAPSNVPGTAVRPAHTVRAKRAANDVAASRNVSRYTLGAAARQQAAPPAVHAGGRGPSRAAYF